MDLSTIEQKLEDSKYTSLNEVKSNIFFSLHICIMPLCKFDLDVKCLLVFDYCDPFSNDSSFRRCVTVHCRYEVNV